MSTLYQSLKVMSIVLFLYYGLSVLTTNAMVKEFERYGLVQFRKLTGGLEVLGSLGLLAGYFIPQLVIVASGGLTLLMVAGVVVRFRAGDSVTDALQASFMLLVNLFIFIYALGLIS